MNAVIYARYSSHGQTEQSIEGQLRDCYTFAERDGYTVLGEYIDRAISGRTDDRPDFQRLIKDAQKKQFQVVIVWKLDRFARNRYDSAMYKAKLKKYGVRVISATENISDSPEGIIMEGLLESMAEYYSANLSKHVKRGQRESIMKGIWTGGTAPIGYKLVDKRLVVDPETAPIVRYLFEEYAKGVPKKDIVAALNDRGIRTRTGNPLTLSSFQQVLRNEKYIGVWRHNGEVVAHGCPRIVSDELFHDVQKKLDSVRRAPGAKKAKTNYLLQGKAFCGMCGAPMVGECGRSRSGEVYHYYACANRKKHRSCKKRNEKKGFLEWYVVEQTSLHILSPKRIDEIATMFVEQYEKEFGNKQVLALERRIEKLDRDINSAVDASLQAPEKTRKRYFDKIELLETQRYDLALDLSQLKNANRVKYKKSDIVMYLNQFCNGDPLDEEYQQRIIDVFINCVYVFDDKIVIYYHFNNEQQVSYMEMLESTDDFLTVEDSVNVRISNVPASQITPHKQLVYAGLLFLCSELDFLRETCLVWTIKSYFAGNSLIKELPDHRIATENMISPNNEHK